MQSWHGICYILWHKSTATADDATWSQMEDEAMMTTQKRIKSLLYNTACALERVLANDKAHAAAGLKLIERELIELDEAIHTG